MPANHLIRRDRLELLFQGRPDHEIVADLWQSERSRRLLLLNSVIDALDDRPGALGPLPPVGDAVAALETAEAIDPDAFRQVLLLPSVGSWTAYMLRRLHGFAPSDAPLWIDAGVLFALAVVAAQRSGIDLSVPVPLRDGRVMLPGLGMACFPGAGRWAVAEASVAGGRITLRHGDREVEADGSTAGWWPLRRIRCGSGPVLSVALDDLDPFRELAEPVAPERLTDDETAAWTRLLDGAWLVLCRRHRNTAEAMAAGLTSVNPLPPDDDASGRSASTGEAFGALLVSRPADPVTLAVALVHEFAHIQLGGLLHLIDLESDSDQATLYAPWRDDPRPLPGLVQGIYAFTAIAGFWHGERAADTELDREVAAFEYAFTRGQAVQAIGTAARSGRLTDAGVQLLDGLRRRIGSWESHPFAAARLALEAHRAGWRIRHLRPDPEAVRALAEAWSGGHDAVRTRSGDVVKGDASLWSRHRLALIRRAVVARARGRRLEPGPGTDPAEMALVLGDREAARTGFRARIAADPADLDAWTGLALVTDGPARVALTGDPALVRAVHLELGGSGDPAALAEWISAAGAASSP
ncbi:hypothetical protein KOI35_30685 [Actinoplanes bogorensis]|uniref:HEXXH motif domain-containing protein n=1 Tax=Paractinoplanes bogorensis TaxID=1610840 RepID=A0ABS5YWR9_9ACTN|nr:HEXXH motif domain-containing protein [Actinoplanes bogorensis]MBU2667887.1 hypothetical protein [Actinoplanes bogorensis]